MAIENMQTGRRGQATKALKAFNKACKDALAGKPVKSVFEGKTPLLKEMTDYDFKGSEVISRINKRQPDLFGKQLFADILPKGSASEAKAIKALKDHDRSPIKARMGRYAPMFVHIQYHEFEHEGQQYRLHQTQYYNSNFEDKDPTFNPRVTKLDLMKINPDTKDSEDVGEMLVKTDEYIKDLKRLKITKRAM